MLLALVACKDETLEMAKLSDVFPNLPVPPEASVVSREGSPDALMLTFMSNAKPAEVEAYYREVLTRNGWRLVGDTRDAEGAVVFLAEQDGPPLWVRIQSTSDSVATMVELAGAVASRKKELKPAS
ncbi:MAG TPA: hypothetical protein VF061_00990 [Gemmatimonadales bacterium]